MGIHLGEGGEYVFEVLRGVFGENDDEELVQKNTYRKALIALYKTKKASPLDGEALLRKEDVVDA